MSLAETLAELEEDGFPRVSGDEPLYLDFVTFQTPFSPRERG